MSWYKWFSDKFANMLREKKIFVNQFKKNFGEGEVIIRNLQSGIPFDVRKTLLTGGMGETILRGALKGIYKETDSMDDKVVKIRDWVNSKLIYISDQKNYAKPEYWADAYTIYDRKKDDCDGYAVLIMTLMRLAGVPADQRIICVGEVDSGEYHAYVCYFSNDYQAWFAVEGSYLAAEAAAAFNNTPYIKNLRYKTPEWMFNEDTAWTVGGKEIFLNKLE